MKKKVEKVLFNPWFMTALGVIALYGVKLSGTLAWWNYMTSLIWRGGW